MGSVTLDVYWRRSWVGLLALIVVLLILIYRERRDTRLLMGRVAAVEREALALESRHPLAKPAKPAPAQPPPKPPPGALARYSDANLLGDPDYSVAIARRHRRYALANDREAIDSLRLSAAETAQLKEMIASRWIARSDAEDVVQRMGDTPGNLREKALNDVQAEWDSKIAGFLGPERYAALQAAINATATRHVNWQLFAQFADSGAPLTSSQQAALTTTMVELRATDAWNANARPPATATGPTPDEQLLQTSAQFLTPAQSAVLREWQTARDQYQLAVRDAERRRKAAQKGGE